MADATHVPGQRLMQFDKKAPGWALVAMAGVFLVGGIGAPYLLDLRGAEVLVPIVFAALAPFLLWAARSVMSERLVVTTEGVHHMNGKGLAQRAVVEDSATWEEITGLELIVKRESSGSQSSTSYTLVLERKGGEPLRYLVGIPSAKRLRQLRRLCKERGVAVRGV